MSSGGQNCVRLEVTALERPHSLSVEVGGMSPREISWESILKPGGKIPSSAVSLFQPVLQG